MIAKNVYKVTPTSCMTGSVVFSRRFLKRCFHAPFYVEASTPTDAIKKVREYATHWSYRFRVEQVPSNANKVKKSPVMRAASFR